MADQFIGEIRAFGFWLLPAGWVWCEGQSLARSQYPALYDVIGTTYGGDSTNFRVPDLRGRAPMHPGQGPGLSPHNLGEAGGVEAVTLLESEIPQHSHTLTGSSSTGNAVTPSVGVVLAATASGFAYGNSGTPAAMGDILSPTGGEPHNNMQPYLALAFAIAYQGVVPPHP